MNRREFLQRSSLAGTATFCGTSTQGCSSSAPRRSPAAGHAKPFELEGLSIAELQRGLAAGRFTAASLTRAYQHRIAELDQNGPRIKAVLELNPDASAIAQELDRERKVRGPRGPLHGIPVLLKDNLNTHDRTTTTAGSLALEGSIPPHDAFVAARLRAAGAVLLGKTNMSEWANFRGNRSISGWSARGGQTRNPYVVDRSPSGSSSGSAAAVSASFCAVAVGTETNGSIVSPASYCGLVGLKPTVGLVSRSGIIPIAASMDTAGPLARTVADAAALLGAMTGVDPLDPATKASADWSYSDYTRFLDPIALRGARIGVARSVFKVHRLVDRILEAALTALKQEGAILIDPIALPTFQEVGDARLQLMLHEFKDGLNSYFTSLGSGAAVKSLEELIQFNDRHADRELRFFGQETLIEAQSKGPLTDQAYVDAKARCTKWTKGFAALIEEHQLDAFIAPTSGPAGTLDLINGDHGLGGTSTFAALAGFPNITVPCGDVSGLPVGLSFFGRAWSEPRLIGIAHAFEQATRARKPPRYLPTLDLG